VVTLQALDTLFVDFSVPQQALSRVALGQTVVAKVDTFPDQTFEEDRCGEPVGRYGLAQRADARQSAEPRPPATAWMFTTIDISAGAPEQHITLPQTAITYNPYGSTVYLVEQKGETASGQPQLVARQSFVTTARLAATRWQS